MNIQTLDFQYDLFENDQERALRLLLSPLDAKCDATTRSLDRCRKKLFAQNGELRKQVMDLSQRLEYIERCLCRGA